MVGRTSPLCKRYHQNSHLPSNVSVVWWQKFNPSLRFNHMRDGPDVSEGYMEKRRVLIDFIMGDVINVIQSIWSYQNINNTQNVSSNPRSFWSWGIAWSRSTKLSGLYNPEIVFIIYFGTQKMTKMPTKSDITLFAEIFTKTPLWNLSGNKMKMRLIVPFEG